MDILFLLLGLGILIVGGEFLVRGAVGLSSAFRISPMIIGLTVVSFGTSAPELLVSIQSAMAGNPGIAIGNVIGSNIANIAFILGITVIIFPIIAEKQTKMLDYPVMIFATLLFYVLALNLTIGFWEGFSLVILLLLFVYYLIHKTRKENKITKVIKEEDPIIDPEVKPVSLKLSIMFLVLGLIGLYFGSEWFVGGAVGIAKALELSDSVIGVTVVAIGTSAPELVASIMAALKKQSDISVGNLVGSNIFNVFAVLGITGMVKPIKIEQSVMDFDMLWMIGISLLLIPILYFGDKISRMKGVVLLSCYILYISVLIMKIKGVF